MGRGRPRRGAVLAPVCAGRVPGPLRVLPCPRAVAAGEALADPAVLPCLFAVPRAGDHTADQPHLAQRVDEAGGAADTASSWRQVQEEGQGGRGAPEPLERGALHPLRGHEPHDPPGGPLRPRHHAHRRGLARRLHLLDGRKHQVPRLGDDGAARHKHRHSRALGEVQEPDPREDARGRHLHPPPGAEPPLRSLPTGELAADCGRVVEPSRAKRHLAAGGVGAQDRNPRGEKRPAPPLVRGRRLQDARERPGLCLRRRLVPRGAGGDRL
mmetsp:Transcript_61214/g.163783  ORF Transcript_61214/g.163783 Transcript_61214/m.163783 type:complete len:269 (+) Transcript_61214:712-1518(+)